MTESNVTDLRDIPRDQRDEKEKEGPYADDPRNLPPPTVYCDAEDLRIRWRYKSKDPVWTLVRKGKLKKALKIGQNHSLWPLEDVLEVERKIFEESTEAPIADFKRQQKKRG